VRNRLSVLALAALLAAALLPSPRSAGAEAAKPDSKATALADKVMQALGGAKAWNNTHYLRFDFAVDRGGKTVVRRAHTWDKWTGRYRLEATNKKGDPSVVLMNVNTKEGSAFLKGKQLEGKEAKKHLEEAYATWVNDTYWLLMPYKLRDPGVTLQYAGDTTVAGATYDRVALSFENVGETPGDHYWVWVNRGNHRVERWDMVLQSDQPPPKSYTWEGWEQHGGLWFATAHRQPPAVVYTRNLEIVSKFGDQEFRAP